jgi:hypothetical protein
MTEFEQAQLRATIERSYGGRANFLQSVPVEETFDGKTVWLGVVHIFGLRGNPNATRAYAWSSPIEGSARRRFFAMLHMGAVTSPVEAVRMALVPRR